MRARLRSVGQRLSLLARPRTPETLPIVLDRRRIYVLPTRFGLFVAALLVAMLLGALNYNNNPALLLALLLATAGIASSILAHLQLSGLRVEAVSAEPVVAGEPLRMRISLARRDQRARRGLRLDHRQQSADCTLMERDSAEVDLQVPTERRGWQDIARIRLSTTQPLGLVRAWSWAWPETPLLAYPQPELAGPPLPDGSGAPNRTRLHAQGEELHQLRPYRAGDAPRTIAWKHSARRDSLLVREYEQPLGVQVTLDWRALASLPYERRISRLAHWVNLAEREGRRYRLLLPGHPVLGPSHGPAHHHLCLRALALLPHA
ncbi:DUF58 domain-containing protein [Xanthomonas maliensis]|uniref:DUF58 domain-containing protein n=1 Tax=Xanthomonas maliensis TaxID=1321368 RepID=UPI0003A3676A|nr:DUF58 domain-containing protein [Xanthomonas maliensis]KAB7766261.1 DUF58 domain-containing protein [Xanthomonas maliensis]